MRTDSRIDTTSCVPDQPPRAASRAHRSSPSAVRQRALAMCRRVYRLRRIYSVTSPTHGIPARTASLNRVVVATGTTDTSVTRPSYEGPLCRGCRTYGRTAIGRARAERPNRSSSSPFDTPLRTADCAVHERWMQGRRSNRLVYDRRTCNAPVKMRADGIGWERTGTAG